MSGNYLLDNSMSHAEKRFEALSALFDDVTLRHLCDVGLKAGWRCWEVGAGGPAVPSLIASVAGPTGFVLATDINTVWLPDTSNVANTPNATHIQVMRHDVEHDDILPESFDLVHARLVLVHLRQRDAVMKKLVHALKPGGWLVIEEADPGLQPLACLEERGRAEVLANRIRRGFRHLMAERGVDLEYGRTLPRVLCEAELCNVGADVFFPLCRHQTRTLEIATIDMLRDKLIAAKLATHEEIEECVTNLARLPMDIATAPLVSAWGQKRNIEGKN